LMRMYDCSVFTASDSIAFQSGWLRGCAGLKEEAHRCQQSRALHLLD